MVPLREYQEEGIELVRDEFRKGNKKTMLVMPTGTGKTTVFSAMTKQSVDKGSYVLIVVHRVELVNQIVERLAKFNIEAGIIAANYPFKRNAQVQVASIQTLTKRHHPPADIVIIDECHHCLADSYQTLWGIYPRAFFLGVTATPVRLNGEGFGDSFESLISLKNLHWFFNNHDPISGLPFLVRPIHKAISVPDFSSVGLKGGDYNKDKLSEIMNGAQERANVIDAYFNYAEGLKSIVFSVKVSDSKNLLRDFLKRGVKAAHLDGSTDPTERKKILSQFTRNEITLLLNVDLFGEGFDVPDTEVCIMNRLTKSLSLYKQQAGRVFRPANGKATSMVLDCVGMWYEHLAYAYDDHVWSLDGKPKIAREIAPPVLAEVQQVFPECNIADLPLFAQSRDGKLMTLPTEDSKPGQNNRLREEIKNVNLVPVSQELRRLVIFEAYLQKAKVKKHKLLSAVFDYQRYLQNQETKLTMDETDYCKSRMVELGVAVKEGFWYHLTQNAA